MSSLVKGKDGEESTSDEEFKGKGIKVGKMLGVDESDSSGSSSTTSESEMTMSVQDNKDKVSQKNQPKEQPLETPKFNLDKPAVINEEPIEEEKKDDDEEEVKQPTASHKRSKSAVQ